MEIIKSSFKGSYNYTLFLEGSVNNRFIKYKVKNGKKGNFEYPVTKVKTPKIYIVQHSNKIVYVGYAGQPIANRLRGGLVANGKNGYHGYCWKKYDEVTLRIFVFEPFQGDQSKDKEHKLFVEAIEAELVFKVRNETGNWPESQNEIHFNNYQPIEVKLIAEEIYKKVTA